MTDTAIVYKSADIVKNLIVSVTVSTGVLCRRSTVGNSINTICRHTPGSATEPSQFTVRCTADDSIATDSAIIANSASSATVAACTSRANRYSNDVSGS
jgi:hypothetical protein